MYVRVGEYPEYKKYGINQKYCGLRFEPKEIELKFGKKCFNDPFNQLNNKTIWDIEGVTQQFESVNNRVFKGADAEYSEAPWSVFITNRWGNIFDEGSCSGVLIAFNWVLTAAHCKGYYSIIINYIMLFQIKIECTCVSLFYHRLIEMTCI